MTERSNDSQSLVKVSSLLLVGVMALAGMGYVVGLTDGAPQIAGLPTSPSSEGLAASQEASARSRGDGKTIAAIRYADVPASVMGPTKDRLTRAKLPAEDYDLFAKVELSPEDKQQSTMIRAARRAFNGAPPVIPHAIQDTNDAACYACHGKGVKIGDLQAAVMSHPFLANCTQCHAGPAPPPFVAYDAFVQNDFQGLPAPLSGERAFPGAPPTIPHSQWMRQNCNACHGGPNGWAGLESTHPWRTNCTQCHAPSAVLDQAVSSAGVPMLPGMTVKGL